MLSFALWPLVGCVHLLPPTMVPGEIVTATTADGWVNDLRHYPGDGPPVLLVHGMAVNHYNFDFREEVSLAAELQRQGFDVWVPELRGDPGSVPPDVRRRDLAPIDFDAYATLDVAAAVHTVLERTGREDLYWVGHSMGGMLLYAWLAQEPDTVAAGVAICSPSTFEAQRLPLYVRGVRFALGGDGRVPARGLATLTRPIGRANPFYTRLANRSNLDWPVANGLAKHALSDIPKPLARQAFGWVRANELTTRDGEPWIAPADVPLLVLGAPRDKVVSEPDVRATCDVFPDCTYRLLAVSEGFSVDYGHVDPVVGLTARTEVYPLVTGFLAEQREREVALTAPIVGGP